MNGLFIAAIVIGAIAMLFFVVAVWSDEPGIGGFGGALLLGAAVLTIGGFATDAAAQTESALRADLDQASHGRINVHSVGDNSKVKFDLNQPDGTPQISCEGTAVQAPNGHYVLAAPSLTPACAAEWAKVSQG
jgi:hypothetical protein